MQSSKSYQNKRVLVWDTGEGIEHARALAKSFEKVYYYKPWQANLPKFVSYAPGMGLEFEKVKNFFDYLDRVDLVVFASTGQGDLASWLRRHGHRVFGAGRSEVLEQNRLTFKKLCKLAKLDLPPWKSAKGIKEVRSLFAGGQWVKSDIFRGDKETFRAFDDEELDLHLNQIASQTWPFREEIDFVIENHVEGVEPGIDAFFSNGAWSSKFVLGYEGEYQGYLGEVCDEKSCPGSILSVLEAFQPPLTYLDCRSAVSMEFRVDDEGVLYPIDITPRFPYVLSLIYPEVISNYCEIIWETAEGNVVKPEFKASHVGLLALESTEVKKAWVQLNYPKSLENHIKHVMFCQSGSHRYMVKGTEMPQCFVILGWGDSYQDVIEQITSIQDEVQCDGLVRHQEAELSTIAENIKKGKSLGI